MPFASPSVLIGRRMCARVADANGEPATPDPDANGEPGPSGGDANGEPPLVANADANGEPAVLLLCVWPDANGEPGCRYFLEKNFLREGRSRSGTGVAVSYQSQTSRSEWSSVPEIEEAGTGRQWKERRPLPYSTRT